MVENNHAMPGDNPRSFRQHIDYIRSRKIIWHFCTPKSASSYLMGVLKATTADNPRVSSLRALPVHLDRPQVICPYTIAQTLEAHPEPDRVFIAEHAHTLATEELLQAISENHVVIVQTRSILDTIISLVEFKTQAPRSPFGVTDHLFWGQLTYEEKIDHIINVYAPWHLDFVQGWAHAAVFVKQMAWVRYDSAVKNTAQVVSRILQFQKIADPPVLTIAKEAMNFNVGVAGRGEAKLSDLQKAKVADLTKMTKRFWGDDPLVMSSLG